jgi:hypothetical protein
MICRDIQAGSSKETHQSRENGKQIETLEKTILLSPFGLLTTHSLAFPLSISIPSYSMFSLFFCFEDGGSMFF